MDKGEYRKNINKTDICELIRRMNKKLEEEFPECGVSVRSISVNCGGKEIKVSE